ncbi:MAG: hypothetical protein AUI14_18210 [Actinobacteria bacterium 13_2_20CM_2_71_6]|nr:MAG: hypothetical protein AUI14_18210 [Actinobacteria bacterium 13_2_20CM_2_71_6]
MQPYPMAASVAIADILTGLRRRVEVAAVTPQAVYLATGDPETPALCLAGPAAVRVPCALVLAQPPPRLSGAGAVGDGEVTVGEFRARVARWWRPRAVRVFTTGVRPEHGADPELDGLVDALASGAPLDVPVLRLLGRGPGLTPLGDDILAGALVTLAALGVPAFHRLRRVVREYAPSRTTFVSYVLLHHAARGECVPELADFLAGGPADALLRVGHSSGAGLLRGAVAATSLGALR